MRTVTIGSAVALLDEMTGCGLLKLAPDTGLELEVPEDLREVRVMSDGSTVVSIPHSLWEAEWNEAWRALHRIGWEPVEDEWGWPIDEPEGVTADGCEVYALYGSDPITSQPSMEEIHESYSELRKLAGL